MYVCFVLAVAIDFPAAFAVSTTNYTTGAFAVTFSIAYIIAFVSCLVLYFIRVIMIHMMNLFSISGILMIRSRFVILDAVTCLKELL